jgi:hypothetical protein
LSLNRYSITAIAAGIMEFTASGAALLMSLFSLTGYYILERFPQYRYDPIVLTGLGIGIVAFISFILGFIGSVSAMSRKNFTLSILGTLATAFWGSLTYLYTRMIVTDPEAFNNTITITVIVILLSVFSVILLVASRRAFKPRLILTT